MSDRAKPAEAVPLNQHTVSFSATNLTAAQAKFLGEIHALFGDPQNAEALAVVMKSEGCIALNDKGGASVLTYAVVRQYFAKGIVEQFLKQFNQ
jgi:hypothetical protein